MQIVNDCVKEGTLLLEVNGQCMSVSDAMIKYDNFIARFSFLCIFYVYISYYHLMVFLTIIFTILTNCKISSYHDIDSEIKNK